MNQERPELSVVIPARNEAHRLPSTLLKLGDWIRNSGRATEIIPVVQGDDDTALIVEKMAHADHSIRPLIQRSGNGKGFAVREGIAAARGLVILFTDADLSVPAECLEKLVSLLESRPDLDGIIGSRRLPGSRIVIRQPLMRRLSGKAFNLALRLWGLTDFQDTQCGCKLFRHDAAKAIFARSQLNGFAFDVEVLKIAELLGYKLEETPVVWADAGGSRVWLPRDGFKALQDAWSLRKRFS